MFKIDKSAVEYLDQNKSNVVIKQWVKQEGEAGPVAAAPLEHREEQPAQAYQQPVYRQEIDPAILRAIEHKQREADALVARADQEAERILGQARERTAELFQQAKAEGYQQGLTEAREQDILREQEYKQFFERLQQAVEQRQDERDAALSQNILELAVAITKKVINIKLEKDDIVFVGLLKEAIKRLNAKDKFVIRLHEREYGRFFKEGSSWLAEATQSAPFSVMIDEEIEPGGLLLTSAGGRVDAGVGVQMEKIAQALHVQDDG